MIKLVIFDLFGTLAYECSTARIIKRKKKLKISKGEIGKRFERAFQTKKWKDKYSAYKYLCKELGIKSNDQNIMWLMNLRDKREKKVRLYKYTLPLLKKLKKEGYKTALLSNTSVFSAGYLKQKTNLLNYIDKTRFSFEYGDIKPSPKGFNLLLRIFKIKPNEALMIGNTMIDDIVPAKKLGINTILFISPAQLKKDLKRFKINI